MTMPDPEPPIVPTAEVEAAATRRRWITLAEILGVAAVLISGLTLWNSYRERTSQEAEKAAAKQEASAEARILLLRANADRDGERLRLAPAEGGQTIQSQTIAFPGPLGVAAVDTVSDSRIEGSWFERALLRARESEGGDGANRGDERLPVAITTLFFSGGAMHRDSAIYDVGYRIDEGGLLGGRKIRLRGISRVQTVPPRAAQARLDAIWQARHPPAARH
jgi:hypothetical protein